MGASAGASRPSRRRITAARQYWGSKLRRAVEIIERLRAVDAEAKCVVFVQWDDLRQQMSDALSQVAVAHLVLQGDVFERTRALTRFQSDAQVPLLLLSLEDSASGTNLTAASHVMLLHPMLAPTLAEAQAAEAQAIGRVRRFGQRRHVHVWRLYASSTVEESLLQLLCPS